MWVSLRGSSFCLPYHGIKGSLLLYIQLCKEGKYPDPKLPRKVLRVLCSRPFIWVTYIESLHYKLLRIWSFFKKQLKNVAISAFWKYNRTLYVWDVLSRISTSQDTTHFCKYWLFSACVLIYCALNGCKEWAWSLASRSWPSSHGKWRRYTNN